MAQKITNAKGNKYALISEEMYKLLKNMNQNADQTESPEFKKIKLLDDQISELLKNKTIPASKKARMYALIAGRYMDLRDKELGKSNLYEQIPPLPHTTSAQMESLARSPERDLPELFKTPEKKANTAEEEIETISASPYKKIIFSPQTPTEEEKPTTSKVITEEKGKTPTPLKQEEERTRYDKYLDLLPKNAKVAKQKAEEIFKNIDEHKEEFNYDPNTNEISIMNRKIPGTDIGELMAYTLKRGVTESTPKPKHYEAFLEALARIGIPSQIIPSAYLKKKWNVMEVVKQEKEK